MPQIAQSEQYSIKTQILLITYKCPGATAHSLPNGADMMKLLPDWQFSWAEEFECYMATNGINLCENTSLLELYVDCWVLQNHIPVRRR